MMGSSRRFPPVHLNMGARPVSVYGTHRTVPPSGGLSEIWLRQPSCDPGLTREANYLWRDSLLVVPGGGQCPV